jgi:aminopeptidase N
VGFEHLGRELMIDLGATAPSGEAIDVTITYSGTPESVPADAVPFSPGWQRGDEVGYLFSQPDGAQSLFPVNDHPQDRADVQLAITVPPGVEAISGGRVISEASSAAGETVVWHMEDIAPYLIPLGVGEFTLVSDEVVDGVRYDVWVSDDLVGMSAIDTFEVQPEIVAFFEERFGPYPFDRAGALIVDDLLGAALETQTIPTYTVASAQWGEVVIAHELAHQWFGDAITLEQWDDIWLNEGFATFAHWLWMEESLGVARYDSEIEDAYGTFSGRQLVESGVAEEVAANRVREAFPPPDDPRGADLFNRSVYERGGLTLVALRDAVGDDELFELLRTYTERFTGSTVTTEAFVALVDEVLGSDAAALVSAWVTNEDVPPLPGRDLTPLQGG